MIHRRKFCLALICHLILKTVNIGQIASVGKEEKDQNYSTFILYLLSTAPIYSFNHSHSSNKCGMFMDTTSKPPPLA